MTPLADDLWVDTAPVRILGMRLTSTMVVIRLGESRLLVYSPLALTPERRAAVEALGTVAHLYAPNTFHHLWMGDWAAAFASARLHAPAGLAAKRPDLSIHRVHASSPEPDFEGVVEEHPIAGFRLEETALLHRPSRTLVVADLVHNVGRPDHAWTKLYTRMMGFHDRVAISRAIRWTAFPDRIAARRSLDDVLARGFDRLIVGHGTPIENGAAQALASAFDWLPAAR